MFFGTLAIDLGSSTTVVVFQKENGQPPELLDLPPISRAIGEIPSLIWKSSEKRRILFNWSTNYRFKSH